MDSVALTQLLDATGGVPAGVAGDACVTRVCTDSRTLRPGDAFWALRGERHDGHNFVAEARQRGAKFCVVEQQAVLADAGPCVRVADTRQALGEFARWYRHQMETLVIGVTGSVGKTTTREVIHAVLSAKHAGVQSLLNYNNEIGLPLSLLELTSEHEYGVFELGAARVGDIRSLCELAYPEVGVLTRVGVAHLATFGSIEAIRQAKGELLDALPPHGFAVVHGDDEQTRALGERAACNTIHVGERPGNQVRATDVECGGGKLRFVVDRKKYELQAVGRHHLAAALCAIAIGREIGMEPASMAEGMRRFRGQPGRCQPLQIDGFTLIDDTYNANPTSMEAACQCLRDCKSAGRRILVVGDMLELGGDAARCHQELGAHIAAAEIEHVLALGDQASAIMEGARRAGMSPHRMAQFQNLDALLTILDCWLEPGDVLLVKGSRGMHMERVVLALQQRGQLKEKQNKGTIRAVA